MFIGHLFRLFFSFNRAICTKIEQLMREQNRTFSNEYNHLCASFVNEHSNIHILDIGTGKRLIYSDLLHEKQNHIIGCDIDEREIAHNSGIHASIVCDASKEILLPDQAVDFISSHYCIEHLPDVQRFIQECARVLKSDGQLCVIFAAQFSLHAVLNQLIPHTLAKQFLYFLLPGVQSTAGFRAYYDQGTYSAFSSLLQKEGFEILDVKHQYGSRGYFMFFIPCYLLVLAFDQSLSLTKNRNLAADYIFIARRVSKPNRTKITNNAVLHTAV